MKSFYLILLSAALSVLFYCRASAQNITTIAGGGNLSGENKPAFVGQVTPYGIVLDAAGNIYVTDNVHDVIKKISPTGIFTTIAGTGVEGFSGDGGPATNAMLHYPSYIAIDPSGNIFFTDELNDRVRMISTAGIISTIAGNGVTTFNGDGIAATSAQIAPKGIAITTSGDIIIADYNNNRIRKVSSGIITTIAGDGTWSYGGDGGPATAAYIRTPSGVTINRAGEIIFIDGYLNDRIRKISATGIITTIAGTGVSGYSGDGGPATDAKISPVRHITTDTSGNLYYLDLDVIRKINSSGIISRFSGTLSTHGYEGDRGPATAALFAQMGMAFDLVGNLIVADHSNYVIRKIDTAGIVSTIAGNNFPEYSGDNGPVADAVLAPYKTRYDTAGNLYFVDSLFHTVRKISPSGIVTRVAGYGRTAEYSIYWDGDKAIFYQFYGSSSSSGILAIAPARNGTLFISDRNGYSIKKVDTAGYLYTIAGVGTAGYGGDGGPATAARFRVVESIAVDTIGNLYLADQGNFRVRKISTSGIITTVAGTGTMGYSGDGGPATAANMSYPMEVALDRSENIYIGDYSGRIRKINTSGIISTIAGTGTPGYSGDGGPATAAQIIAGDMSFDRYGNMYLSQKQYHVVRKIDTAGIITTFSGIGTAGFSGDGGPATNAKLNSAYGTEIDRWGNVYIADESNHRIRFVCARDTLVSSLGITASASAICAGQPVTFSATDTNAGPSPSYQWVINGTNVSGATTATFTSTTLSSTDTVWCEMTGNNPAPCAINNSDTSNRIVVTVTPISPTPSITSVTATPPKLSYLGEPITFTAVITGAGSSPVIQWYNNGIAIPGATTNPYTSATMNPGDVVLVSVRTTDPCAFPDSARSSIVTIGSTIGVKTLAANDNKINLYPNPNNGSFTVQGLFPGSKECTLEITNPLGEVIYRQFAATTNQVLNTTIKLDNRTKGLYFMRILTGHSVTVYRFIVQ